MGQLIPTSVQEEAFSSFDPYSISENKNPSIVGQLGLNYVTRKAQKLIVSAVTFNDGVFGLTDTMVTGLAKVWRDKTRSRNKELLQGFIKFYTTHPAMPIETGLYTLMILASLPIGKTTLDWHSQLKNPIRGKVIWAFIRNVPKSLSEGSDYFENVGKDLTNEQEIPCKYYFDELNKTLIAFLSLTCYYLKRDPKPYFRSLECSGYEWLDCPDAGTKEIYRQICKFVIPKSACYYKDQTIADVYRSFDSWDGTIRMLYRTIGQPVEDACQYVSKHGIYYLSAFSAFE